MRFDRVVWAVIVGLVWALMIGFLAAFTCSAVWLITSFIKSDFSVSAGTIRIPIVMTALGYVLGCLVGWFHFPEEPPQAMTSEAATRRAA